MAGLLNGLPGEWRISAIRSRGHGRGEPGIEVVVNHVIVLATKTTHAGNIGSVRRSSDDKSCIYTQGRRRTAGSVKVVTGFRAASQYRVYQAGRSRAGSAGRRSRQIRQSRSIANIGIGGSVGCLSGHDAANRGDCGRLIGGNSGAYQVGNGDG